MASGKDKPSDSAVIERAFSLASEAMYTVDLQCRRIKKDEPEDNVFPTRRWIDLRFLVSALVRLRLAARIIGKAKGVSIDNAIDAFKSALPHLQRMRDVAEHIDEYAVDCGHDKSVKRQSLAVGVWDGTTITWLGESLNINKAREAAEVLFDAIRSEKTRFLNQSRC